MFPAFRFPPTGGINSGASVNLLDNSITSALGLNTTSSDGPPSLNSFVSKFGTSSQFEANFLTNTLRARGEWGIRLKFHPSHSRVRWMLSQALNAADASPDFQFFVDTLTPPDFKLMAELKGMTGYKKPIISAGDGMPNVELSQNTFEMSLLSTEYSLAHHVFYYWMKEAASPYWAYITTSKKQDNGLMNSLKNGANAIGDAFMGAIGMGEDDKSGNFGEGDEQQGKLELCYPYTTADFYIQHFAGDSGEALETLVIEDCYPFQIKNYAVDNENLFKKNISVTMHCANAYISSPFYGKKFQSSLTSSVAGQILEQNLTKYVSRVYGNVSRKIGLDVSDTVKKVTSAIDVVGNANKPF